MNAAERFRALMIVSQAMEACVAHDNAEDFTPAAGKIDRIWGWISANGNVDRYVCYLMAQQRQLSLAAQTAAEYRQATDAALVVALQGR